MARSLETRSPEEVAREVVERVRSRVEEDRIELASFHTGVAAPPGSLPHGVDAELFGSAVKKAANAALAATWKLDLFRPDAAFVWDLGARRLEVRLKSLFVYGRYVKLDRTLPQTLWTCIKCRGLGCKECRQTGRTFKSSVEDVIGQPLGEAFRCEARRPILHGMGREDMDARTLGAGRPFVIEIAQPRARTVDLEATRATIVARASGKVELPSPLVLVPGELVGPLKELNPRKRYRALVEADRVEPAQVAALEATFRERVIEQRTPGRVKKGRANVLRKRLVVSLVATVVDETRFSLEVLAEGGTYIKELVSGDEGRTKPSIAAELGLAARVVELDVLDVLVSDDEVLRLVR